jgi:hypothetical protein
MAIASAQPPVHSYDGESPYELIDSKWGRLERWRALAMATGETSALTELSKQVRNDAAGISARLDAREAALNSREDSISARELQHAVNVTQFVDFVGKASVLFDKLHKMRADAADKPLATPPGTAGDPSKEPEPALELEDTEGELPDPDNPVTADETEFPDPELPHPPAVQEPVSAGLDKDIEEANRGD